MTKKVDSNALVSNRIEDAVANCGVVAVREQAAFMQAVRMAYGIRQIKEALTDDFVRENIMPLQGSPLGFITDKDREKGYPLDVVRDVACEALLRGFNLVGNEFNIISGRFYGAKNGFERIVREFPGVHNVQVEIGVPHLAGDRGALVPCVARWTLEGEDMELRCAPAGPDGGMDTRIPVKINAGMGPDAIIGKATRKLYARVYQRLTGCASDIVETEAEVVPPAELPAPAAAVDDGRRMKMGRGKPAETVDDERAAIQGEG